ncbi:DNA-binding protein [Tessaracoccus sp. MC1679]|jgi:predicted transcriptional regulator|uniref:DNA-binding protein n=1 Tax=Tessaracoccus sp. MC1679 TaxID=2760313 RepID=UPI001601E727|nr:DNA-binding protein [Tessaracoccus sp. MC1679]MBB1515772.1 DNA-binding protein [Tessaracoccus sp. MC1679]
MSAPEDVNRQTQRELYGEPVADIVGRIMSSLGLTQVRLAEVLGLSAPMLSQLIGARRVKIGNPAVLGRLQSLTDLAAVGPGLTADEKERRLAAIHEAQPTMSTMRDAGAVDALRAAAPAEELRRLSEATTAPRLASLLRLAADAPIHG